MLLRRLALTFTLSLLACASPPVPPTATPDTIPPPARANGRGESPPPQANNVVAGDAPPTATVKVATPAPPTSATAASFQRPFDAKRLVPAPVLIWPPEQVGGGAVWRSPTSCRPFGVYKDRVVLVCTSDAVTVAVLDAATGNARWGLRIDGLRGDPLYLLSDDGKIAVTHRVDDAAYGFEARELIVLDSKDGSLLGAYGIRGNQMRLSQRGVVFLQKDYDKPSQIITFDWHGNGRMIAEHKADVSPWIDIRGGDPWVIYRSRQHVERFTEDHFRWDGARVASAEADNGPRPCKGFSTFSEQSGKRYCIDQKGDRIVYQLEEGGPVIEHVGAQGLLLDDGDIIRAYGGYVACHKPVRIDNGAVKKLK